VPHVHGKYHLYDSDAVVNPASWRQCPREDNMYRCVHRCISASMKSQQTPRPVRRGRTYGVSAALYGDPRLRYLGLVRHATLGSYRKKAQLSMDFKPIACCGRKQESKFSRYWKISVSYGCSASGSLPNPCSSAFCKVVEVDCVPTLRPARKSRSDHNESPVIQVQAMNY